MLGFLIYTAALLNTELSQQESRIHVWVIDKNTTCESWALVANRYIDMGERKTFEEFSDKTSNRSTRAAISNNYEAHMTRLVFKPKPGKKLRGPALGAWFPSRAIPLGGWPFFPFAYQDGVWFLLVEAYKVAGVPEPWQHYFKYCQEQGTFRTTRFTVPTSTQAKAALKSLLKSQSWGNSPPKSKHSSLFNWLQSQTSF